MAANNDRPLESVMTAPSATHTEIRLDASAAANVCINLEADASAAIYIIDEDAALTPGQRSITLNAARGSSVDIFIAALEASRSEIDINARLNEPGCRFSLNGFAIIGHTDSCGCRVNVEHRAPRCHSSQLVKFIVDDNARGSFNGLIKVCPGAVGTEAYQNNRNILVSKQARMHAEPQLEIYCDDVKCSHGSATGQLDERALFYMRSRGIDLATARTMLMNAFLCDVLDSCPDDNLREHLSEAVTRRLS